MCKHFGNMGFILLYYFMLTFFAQSYSADEIDYYENLIKTEINKAYHYELPTSADAYRPKTDLIEDFGTYDFVVVGSGCGGSVVANRLSEIKEWKVLLIEAGGPETNFSVIPGMSAYLQKSRMNWNMNTTRQKKACLGMIDQICPIPRGMVLGGSSSINGLLYSRGHRNDFDRWAKIGSPGWSYKDVLPYFIKSENSQINGDPGYHGREGYWNVKYCKPNSKQMTAFIEGSRTVRYSTSSGDFNGKEELGAFYNQINNIKQYRHSTSKAFLEPVANRTNLKILTYSYVTKILINPTTKKVIAVEFTKNGSTYTVNVQKEVVLSAGAINSPQILMLSGIGPQNHLEKMKISVIKDLPVGKNLHDHEMFYGCYINTNSSAPDQSLKESIKQFLDDSGPLTIPENSQGLGFYQKKFSTNLNGHPDFELKVNPSGGIANFIKQTLRITDEVYQAILESVDPRTTMTAAIYSLRSHSVGEIILRSNDPFLYPIVDANYLVDMRDVEIIYEGLITVQDILKSKPMREINASLVYVDYPQCRNHKMGSKDYWVCALRLLTAAGNHLGGTCKMGSNKRNSVVDYRGRVHEISGLRVADASVIPFSLAGHSAAPTVMIGEKISDHIKLDHGYNIDLITNVID